VLDPLAAIGWEVIDRIRFGADLAISPHGLGIAAGYLAGSYVFMHEGRKRGLGEEVTGSLVLWALVGALVGARFFYVLAHFGEPGLETIGDALAVWRGGISLIGGIFGAIFFAYPTLRKHRIPFLRAMDPAVTGIGLGIVIGRIGDLIIGDHLGKPTSWALAFTYQGGDLSGYDCTITDTCRTTLYGGQFQQISEGAARLHAPSGEVVASGVGVHQTALYDFASTILLVLLLLYLNTRPRRMGVLALTFGLWYGTVRVVTDFLRVDKRFFGMTGSQWASVLVIVLCLATFAWFARRPERGSPASASEPAEPTHPG
jgi:phosphatidylglycerol---prolipoprotein diacylglyceryl transferase